MKKTFLILILLLSYRLFSIDRFVDPNLSVGNGTTIFTTITSAINASVNGDNIIVVSTTYNEPALTINKSLKIMPETPGTVITFNQNITIAGFAGMNLEITGFKLIGYSFISNSISGGTALNRAKVSIISCTASNIYMGNAFYLSNIINNNVTEGINFSHGQAVKNTAKYLVLNDEPQNNINTDIKNVIISNSITYLIGVYNNDYPFIIANNSLRDLSIIRWNANQALTNKIINNNFSNDATLNFSSINVPYYNFVFSSNKFNGTFYGISQGSCSPVNGNYNQSQPSNFDYQNWFPNWAWCCNGPYGWYCANWPNCVTYPTRPPNFNCYSWLSGGSTQWPNLTVNGFFEWSYNGVNFTSSSTVGQTLNFTKIVGQANYIDGGKPSHDFYDIDLTINDRGISGGPFTSINYNQGNSKSIIYYLEMPADLFPTNQLDITANACHVNLLGGSVNTGLKITDAEYFFGVFDPGAGSGTPIIAIDNNFDHGIETLQRIQATWNVANSPTLFNIRAKDANGNWGTLFKKTVFTYGIYPNANLIAEGDTMKVCPNSNVTLSYNGPNGYASTWFNGMVNDSVTFTVSNAGYYGVTSTLGNSTYIDSIYIHLNPIPTPSISPAGAILVCGSSAITLTTQASSNTTFKWYFNNNLIGGATNNTYLPTQVGTYYVVATSTANGCNGVSPSTSLISAAVITPSGTVSSCTNPIVLTAPIGTGNSYQWKLNSINILGATSYTYNAINSGNYAVTITNGACVSTSPNTTINLSLSSPTITTSASSICQGGNLVLNANSGSNLTYQWQNNGTIINGATSSSYTAATAGSYAVVVTNSIGCSATSTVVNLAVQPSPTLAVSNATICSGNSANLTATGATTYSWNTGGTTASISVTPSTTTNYTVTGTTNGCTNTKTVSVNVKATPTVAVSNATICSGNSTILIASGANTYSWNTGATTSSISVAPINNTNYSVTGTTNGCSKTKTVSVNVKATPTVAVSNATICSGNSANIAATGATTYSWNTGATTSSISVTPTTTSNYIVIGTTNGCANTKTVSVTVNQLPIVNLGSIQSPLCVNNSTVSLSGTPLGGVFAGIGVSGASFNPAISGAGTFTINYIYTDANNCSAIASQSVNVSLCTGIIELDSDTISIFPNPASTEITITSPIKFTNVKIVNSIGQIVQETKYNNTVSVVELTKGIYFLQLFNENGNLIMVKKFIKE